MIYILLVFFILMAIVMYFLSNKEILSPGMIFCLVYIASIISAILNIKKWNINIHTNTFMVFFIGTLIFCSISILFNLVYKKRSKEKITTQHLERMNSSNFFSKNLIIDNYKTAFIIIFDIIVLCVMVAYIHKFATKYGSFSSFSEMLNIYRKFSSYQGTDEAFPFIMRQLIKVLQFSGFIFIYIFIRNIISSPCTFKKNLVYLIPVFFTILQSLMVSERLKVLQLTATAVFLFYFLWNQKQSWKPKFNIKFLLILISVFVVLLLGFYGIRLFIGRTSQENLITYITRYMGGSIQLFDLFMQDPPESSNIWGKETFYYLNENLHQLGLLKENYIIHLEFRSSNGVVLGNIYTAYRRWIYDFGISGAIILQSILAIIYNWGYQYLKLKSTKSIASEFLLLLYSYLIFTLFMHSIDSNFYRIVVCMGFILSTIEMFIIYYFFIQFDLKSFTMQLKRKLKGKRNE